MIYSGYYCDKCSKAVEYRRKTSEWIPSKTYLIRFARKSGWSIGKSVLCPDCRKSKGK